MEPKIAPQNKLLWRARVDAFIVTCLSAGMLLALPYCSSGGAPPVSIQAPVGTLIAVSAPDSNGMVTVTGSAGAVNADATVIVSNPPRGNTVNMWSGPWIKSAFAQGGNQACTLAASNGSFCVQISAAVCDLLGIAQQVGTASSAETQVQVPGAACGGAGQPGTGCSQPSISCPGGQPFSTNLSGDWVSAFCCSDNAFGPFTGTDTLAVTQNSSALCFTDDQGGTFEGTISGMDFTWNGTTPGSPVVDECGEWVFSDEDNYSKTTTYFREDGSGGGACTGIGARIPAPTPTPPSCPPTPGTTPTCPTTPTPLTCP